MTDVIQGGATVFPSLDLTIMPKKGSAALWYNLDTSGEPDTLTMHAACPVIQGDKWGNFVKSLALICLMLIYFLFHCSMQ